MNMQKESRVYGNNTYTVGEVWEAVINPERYYGTVIGFTSKDIPVVEDGFGNLSTLINTSWTKRKEKVKLYLYKYIPTGAWHVTENKNQGPCGFTFVQTIEVEQE